MNRFNKVAALSAISFALFASVAHAQSNPAAGALAGVAIGNKISGSVSVINGGSSESYASNSQLAAANIAAVNSTNLNAATAAFSATTLTKGSSEAWNYSTGAGQGSAASSGLSAVGVVGATNIANIGVTGDLASVGGLVAGTTDSITAGTNQGGVTASNSAGSIGVSTIATTVNGALPVSGNDNSTVVNGVSLSDTKTGDLSVSNAQGSVNLTTGTDANGNPIVTTLGAATVNTAGGGAFGAAAEGSSIVGAGATTGWGVANAIVPVTAVAVNSAL